MHQWRMAGLVECPAHPGIYLSCLPLGSFPKCAHGIAHLSMALTCTSTAMIWADLSTSAKSMSAELDRALGLSGPVFLDVSWGHAHLSTRVQAWPRLCPGFATCLIWERVVALKMCPQQPHQTACASHVRQACRSSTSQWCGRCSGQDDLRVAPLSGQVGGVRV